MKGIFNKFYNGEINPCETLHLSSTRYKEKQKQYQEQYASFCASLCDRQCEQLEILLDCHAELEDLYHEAYYAEGFKTGICMIIETFYTK